MNIFAIDDSPHVCALGTGWGVLNAVTYTIG